MTEIEENKCLKVWETVLKEIQNTFLNYNTIHLLKATEFNRISIKNTHVLQWLSRRETSSLDSNRLHTHTRLRQLSESTLRTKVIVCSGSIERERVDVCKAEHRHMIVHTHRLHTHKERSISRSHSLSLLQFSFHMAFLLLCCLLCSVMPLYTHIYNNNHNNNT